MLLENSHIAPGSRNWIKKYFDLVDKEDIKLDFSFLSPKREEIFDLIISRSGLIFGSVERLLFAKHLDLSKYNSDESLKILFFESLILIQMQYENKFNQKKFIDDLNLFYKDFKTESWKINLKFGKDVELEKLENSINSRIRVKSRILEPNFWLNTFNNILCIVDVVLFEEFKQGKIKKINSHYDIYTNNLIRGIILAAKLDNVIEKSEQKLINRFLASANLPQMYETDLKALLNKENLSQNDFNIHFKSKRLAIITFSLALYMTEGTHETSEEEQGLLKKLAYNFGLSDMNIKDCEINCRSFLMNSKKLGAHYQNGSISNIYKEFSVKWIRILGRNKEKFVIELKESKELISLISKSTKSELTKEEKEKVKNQFMEILKSMPSIGIFLLPGGAFLLPIILKIVPDLLPSAFRENQIKEKES